jgi:hypothetical protein
MRVPDFRSTDPQDFAEIQDWAGQVTEALGLDGTPEFQEVMQATSRQSEWLTQAMQRNLSFLHNFNAELKTIENFPVNTDVRIIANGIRGQPEFVLLTAGEWRSIEAQSLTENPKIKDFSWRRGSEAQQIIVRVDFDGDPIEAKILIFGA